MRKSSFENELMLEMEKELHPLDKKEGMNNLIKAAEHLNTAIEILEESGLRSKADQVLKILGKLVISQNVKDVAKNKEDIEFYKKILKWLENPAIPVDSDNPQPGEELSFTSVKDPEEESVDEFKFNSLLKNDKPLPLKNDLVFQSIASELGLVDDNFSNDVDDLLNADFSDELLDISEDDEKTFEDAD